jgi:hypothetical protein
VRVSNRTIQHHHTKLLVGQDLVDRRAPEVPVTKITGNHLPAARLVELKDDSRCPHPRVPSAYLYREREKGVYRTIVYKGRAGVNRLVATT